MRKPNPKIKSQLGISLVCAAHFSLDLAGKWVETLFPEHPSYVDALPGTYCPAVLPTSLNQWVERPLLCAEALKGGEGR